MSSLLGLLAPWPLKIVIDSVIGSEPLPPPLESAFAGLRESPYVLLVLTVVGGLILTAIQRSIELLNNYVQTKLGMMLQLDLRSDLFQHIQKLALSYRRHGRVGDLLNRIGVQAGAVSQVSLAILPLAQSTITLVGMFVVAFVLDAQLALLSLIVVPFLYLSIGYYTRKIEPEVRDVRQREADTFSVISEALTLLPITLAFVRERYEYIRFRIQSEETLQARVGLTVRQAVFAFAVSLAAATGTALVIAVGAVHVLSGKLTVGLLLVVITYIGSVYRPLQTISGTVGSLQEKVVDLRMSFEILDSIPDTEDRSDSAEVSSCSGNLKFEDVCFSYPGREHVLKNVSFDVRPHQFVAIVGPTGAGKTTLVSLVPRFYVPQQGRILLDGVELRKLKARSLRSQISIVTQEPILSSESFAANIRYGKPDATDDEVEHAARIAQIHDFIASLPDGYETRAGECGTQLSAGERQRVTLARAFLKNAPVLILDEPTSCLDPGTEHSILSAVMKLIEGRTALMVAHRLSTIQNADLILVMDSGRIVETGSHLELLEKAGLYARLTQSTGPDC